MYFAPRAQRRQFLDKMIGQALRRQGFAPSERSSDKGFDIRPHLSTNQHLDSFAEDVIRQIPSLFADSGAFSPSGALVQPQARVVRPTVSAPKPDSPSPDLFGDEGLLASQPELFSQASPTSPSSSTAEEPVMPASISPEDLPSEPREQPSLLDPGGLLDQGAFDNPGTQDPPDSPTAQPEQSPRAETTQAAPQPATSAPQQPAPTQPDQAAQQPTDGSTDPSQQPAQEDQQPDQPPAEDGDASAQPDSQEDSSAPADNPAQEQPAEAPEEASDTSDDDTDTPAQTAEEEAAAPLEGQDSPDSNLLDRGGLLDQGAFGDTGTYDHNWGKRQQEGPVETAEEEKAKQQQEAPASKPLSPSSDSAATGTSSTRATNQETAQTLAAEQKNQSPAANQHANATSLKRTQDADRRAGARRKQSRSKGNDSETIDKLQKEIGDLQNKLKDLVPTPSWLIGPGLASIQELLPLIDTGWIAAVSAILLGMAMIVWYMTRNETIKHEIRQNLLKRLIASGILDAIPYVNWFPWTILVHLNTVYHFYNRAKELASDLWNKKNRLKRIQQAVREARRPSTTASSPAGSPTPRAA